MALATPSGSGAGPGPGHYGASSYTPATHASACDGGASRGAAARW